MYKSCNGAPNNNNELSKSDSKLSELQKQSVESVHSSEPNFHGFEKIPLIMCQRMNIASFLKKNSFPSHSNVDTTMLSEKKTNLNKITQDCSVVLIRDDLDKLRNKVNNKTNNCKSNLKCSICSKVYNNDKKLKNHLENKHMLIYKPENRIVKRVSFSDHIIVHEVKEYHSCRKCPKIFENYDKLKDHMKLKHKKRRCYICFYCSKEFVERTFFKVHIKLHCDACGLLLPHKKAYLEHRRTVCKIKKKYDCRICNYAFFNFMDLKDHSYDHLGIFFICDICKDQFQNKCQVSHHINFSHTKKKLVNLYKKQSVNEYICNFCEESFKEEETVLNHVSTLPDLQNKVLTGYKDYNFCDQCFKKFSTETDMLQHKWTHYIKVSDKEKATSSNIKVIYNLNEELPKLLQPKIVLERVKVPEKSVEKTKLPEKPVKKTGIIGNMDLNMIKKPVVDPVSKKTIISKHRCQECGKYLSSNYCLNRHMATVHHSANYKCPVCNERFGWQMLLQKHQCLKLMQMREMTFDDASPEIHFDDLHEANQNGLEESSITDDDYMSMDFDIPAPIVQLTEFDNLNIVLNNGQYNIKENDNTYPMNGLNYKVVMQEVPIEF